MSDDQKVGTLTIRANGKKLVEGRLERTLPIQFSLGEGLDVGKPKLASAAPRSKSR